MTLYFPAIITLVVSFPIEGTLYDIVNLAGSSLGGPCVGLPKRFPTGSSFGTVVASGLLFIVLVGALKGAEAIQTTNTFNANIGLIENLGMTLFNEFLLPFELASILLLAAMVGAVMLGKKSIK